MMTTRITTRFATGPAPTNRAVAPLETMKWPRRAKLALFLSLGWAGALGLSQPAHAELIASFETPDVTEDTTSPQPASQQVDGFQRQGPSLTVDPTDASILGSTNSNANGGQLIGGDGQQLVILATRPADATPNTPQSSFLISNRIFQVLPNTNYTLQVAIADSLATTPPPSGANPGPAVDPAVGDEPGTAQIGFLRDNNAFVGATFDASNYTPEGTLRDFEFTFTSQASDSGTFRILLGQIVTAGTTGREVIGYDNVRLNIAAVPEPSTWAMMFLGVGAMGLVMRRKRDVEA